MLILGIDPGTRILGYSLLDTDDGTFKVVAMDVLYLRNLPDFNQRIRRIFDSTLRIIDSFHPDHLAIEAPFFGKNVQSMLKLGRAQGVAIAAAMSRDLSYTMPLMRLPSPTPVTCSSPTLWPTSAASSCPKTNAISRPNSNGPISSTKIPTVYNENASPSPCLALRRHIPSCRLPPAWQQNVRPASGRLSSRL